MTAVKKKCERLSKKNQCGQESFVDIEKSCNQPKSDETETTNFNIVASQGCQRVQWLAKSPVIYEDTSSDFVTKINQQIHQSLKIILKLRPAIFQPANHHNHLQAKLLRSSKN